MKIICPNCEKEIPQDQTNVVTDLAQCPACSQIHSLSGLLHPQKTALQETEELGDKPEKIIIKEEEDYTYLFWKDRSFKFADGMLIFLELILFSTAIYCIVLLTMIGGRDFSLMIGTSCMFLCFLASSIYLTFNHFTALGVANELFLRADRLELREKLQSHTNTHIIYYNDIENIRMKVLTKVRGAVAFRARAVKNSNDLEAPAIIAKDKTHFFMVLASDAKQEWVIKYINQKLINKI